MQKTLKTGVRYGQNWFFCLNLLKPRPPGEVARLCRDGEGCKDRSLHTVRLLFCKKVSKKTFKTGVRYGQNWFFCLCVMKKPTFFFEKSKQKNFKVRVV